MALRSKFSSKLGVIQLQTDTDKGVSVSDGGANEPLRSSLVKINSDNTFSFLPSPPLVRPVSGGVFESGEDIAEKAIATVLKTRNDILEGLGVGSTTGTVDNTEAQIFGGRNSATALARRVSFTPFKVSIWKRGQDSRMDLTALEGGLSDASAVVGKYIFTFKVPSSLNYSESLNPQSLTSGGKKFILEKYRIDPESGLAQVQVKVIQNPVPIIALIVVALAATGVGIAGFGIADSLEQVDKVVVDTTAGLPKILIFGGAIALLAKFVIFKK